MTAIYLILSAVNLGISINYKNNYDILGFLLFWLVSWMSLGLAFIINL